MELHPAGHQACSPGLSVGVTPAWYLHQQPGKGIEGSSSTRPMLGPALGSQKTGERGAGKWKRPWSGGHQLEEHEPEG